MRSRLRIVVAARISATPTQAGNAWAMLQYLLGLRKLGHDVWFIDVVDRLTSPAVSYFGTLTEQYGFRDRSALVSAEAPCDTVGLSSAALQEAATTSDILLNISGVLRDDKVLAAAARRVYVDLDPAFAQLWQRAEGIDMGFGAHTDFVTVGVNLGQPTCPVPTLDLPWHTTLQPIVIDHWPAVPPDRSGPITTIGNWRGYGSVTYEGVFYGQKAHSLRELMTLPTRCSERLLLALAIDPAEVKDLALLSANGWQLIDPAEACGTPDRYRQFIAGSKAEFGVAKSGYVVSRCGWFSDRSVCYLASGRPVIAQDTGFDRVLPTGRGLFAFRTIEDVLAAVEAMNDDYPLHAAWARGLAEEHFESSRVLSRLLSQLGA